MYAIQKKSVDGTQVSFPQRLLLSRQVESDKLCLNQLALFCVDLLFQLSSDGFHKAFR